MTRLVLFNPTMIERGSIRLVAGGGGFHRREVALPNTTIPDRRAMIRRKINNPHRDVSSMRTIESTSTAKRLTVNTHSASFMVTC